MRKASVILLGAAVALVTACGGDPYADSLPDQSGLALEITGGTQEGIGTSALSADTANQIGQALQDAVPAPTTVPEYLQAAQNGVKELNASLGKALTQISDIVKNNPGKAVTADTKLYGPKDSNGITWRLFVKKYSDLKFGFALQAKVTGADDSTYKLVMAGVLNKDAQTQGTQAHQGRGWVGVDLDNYATVDTTFKGEGKLLAGFANEGASKTLIYFLKNFTGDATAHDPVTAAFVGHKIASNGATAVRLATLTNIAGTATTAKEFVALRVRYLPGTGGRGDLIATGGDIPTGTLYYGVSCWDAQQNETFKALLKCTDRNNVSTTSSSCTVVSVTGDKSTCATAFSTDAPPTQDPNDPTLEPGAPDTNVPMPPTTVADGTQGQ